MVQMVFMKIIHTGAKIRISAKIQNEATAIALPPDRPGAVAPSEESGKTNPPAGHTQWGILVSTRSASRMRPFSSRSTTTR